MLVLGQHIHLQEKNARLYGHFFEGFVSAGFSLQKWSRAWTL
jgi:hypothetical protein